MHCKLKKDKTAYPIWCLLGCHLYVVQSQKIHETIFVSRTLSLHFIWMQNRHWRSGCLCDSCVIHPLRAVAVAVTVVNVIICALECYARISNANVNARKSSSQLEMKRVECTHTAICMPCLIVNVALLFLHFCSGLAFAEKHIRCKYIHSDTHAVCSVAVERRIGSRCFDLGCGWLSMSSNRQRCMGAQEDDSEIDACHNSWAQTTSEVIDHLLHRKFSLDSIHLSDCCQSNARLKHTHVARDPSSAAIWQIFYGRGKTQPHSRYTQCWRDSPSLAPIHPTEYRQHFSFVQKCRSFVVSIQQRNRCQIPNWRQSKAGEFTACRRQRKSVAMRIKTQCMKHRFVLRRFLHFYFFLVIFITIFVVSFFTFGWKLFCVTRMR